MAELDEQITKLNHMADRESRHDYSIGDYWNAVEHAAEVLTTVRDALKATFADLYEGAEIQVPPVKAIAMLKDDVLCGRENFRLTHNGYLRLDKIRVDLQAALDFEVKNSHELVDRIVALKAVLAAKDRT